MAECLAARLAAQEEQIRLLAGEISSLRDGLSRGGLNSVGAAVITPELETLRTENEKLKYRLLHLRRGLQAELRLEEETAKGGKQHGVKCDRAPQNNTSKPQQKNNNNKKVKKKKCSGDHWTKENQFECTHFCNMMPE